MYVGNGDWVLQQNICNGHQILLECVLKENSYMLAILVPYFAMFNVATNMHIYYLNPEDWH